MENNLIENRTEPFWTVRSSENTVVSRSEFYGGKLRDVQVSQESCKAYKYPNQEIAAKVAVYVDGVLIKHTRTTIITEVTEEIKIKGEN